MSILVFIGALFAAVGAFAVASQPDDATDATLRRLFACVILLGAILGAVGGWGMRAHESELRIQFESNLRSRTEELLSTVTGGDGYCTITFLRPFTDRSRAVAVNRGSAPLYDVTVRIADLDRIPEADRNHGMWFDDFMATQVVLDIGNMPCDVMFFLPGPWDFSGDVRRRYRMFFGARNGSWIEDLTLLRGEGNWTYTMTVSRGDSILYEHTDSEYAEALSEYDERYGAP